MNILTSAEIMHPQYGQRYAIFVDLFVFIINSFQKLTQKNIVFASFIIEKILLGNAGISSVKVPASFIRIVGFKDSFHPHINGKAVVSFKAKQERTRRNLFAYALYKLKLL